MTYCRTFSFWKMEKRIYLKTLLIIKCNIMKRELEMEFVEFRDDRPHFQIKLNNEYIGWFSGHIIKNNIDVYYISYLILTDECKGLGLGSYLVQEIIRVQKELKLVKYIELESTPKTLGFWHKFGFNIMLRKKAAEKNCKRMQLIL